MTTLAEDIIVVGAENRPPMLEKSMYDSWASRIRLFIKGKKHGRMMLDSIDNGQLVYPIIEENGQTRPKKYSELTEAQQLQDDCDVQEKNIILHGLPPDVYAFVNHQETAKDIWDRVSETLYEYYWRFSQLINDMHTIGMTMHKVQQGENPIECINKAMAFLSAVASRFLPSNNQLRTLSNSRNQATIQDGRVTVNKFKEDKFRVMLNAAWFKEKLMLAETQEAGQILDEEQLAFLADPDDLDAYDSDYDDLSSAKAVSVANLSSCDPKVLSEVPYSDSYPNDMINQDVQEMQYFEQTHVDNFKDNEIHSGSNIIPYSQYLQETQDAVIQDTTPSAPNDLLVLSLVEQMTDHIAHLDK
ncbi:hypothetical protein Tco_0740070 [Tanacetum coccineum]